MTAAVVTLGALVGGGLGAWFWRTLPKRSRGSLLWYLVGGAAIGAMATAYAPAFVYSQVLH